MYAVVAFLQSVVRYFVRFFRLSDLCCRCRKTYRCPFNTVKESYFVFSVMGANDLKYSVMKLTITNNGLKIKASGDSERRLRQLLALLPIQVYLNVLPSIEPLLFSSLKGRYFK